MPLVINELVFKGTVVGTERDAGSPRADDRRPTLDEKALIERCVEEVLTILKREKER
ncbi:MAG TPA: DUF5908 family protein [Candidatus Deferrimicrobium sp.]|nr:DUF5908 family protein [Candidatus Deferrimicrobium sp.]